MLFLLILSFWGPALLTSGQVWPLFGTPRKMVELRNRGHVFREEGVLNYSTMLLREDLGVLILGARENIFALDLMNINHKKAMVKWAVASDMQKTCSIKGKTLTECQNYIRILHKMPNGSMLVCGTNAFNPTCDLLSYTDGKMTLEHKQQDGKGKCPFDPFQRYASELVDGELYSATSLNFLGSEPVVMRSLNETLRTEFLTAWLNEPNFIAMKHVPEEKDSDDDKIYLFFSETAVEYDTYTKMDVSRVARVCKGDLGGMRTLQKKWTSFLKTSLDCHISQNKLPLLIKDVFFFCPDPLKTCMFYGVFTPQTNRPEYSAVCTYKIQDIRDVFSKGKYKTQYRDSTVSKWVTYNDLVPDPRPGACINSEAKKQGLHNSLDLPDKTLQFIRDKPLMDQAVRQSPQHPLLVKTGAAFTRIVVANTASLRESYQVMFIGTASGSVLKAVNYEKEMVIIEEVQLFEQSEPVTILQLSVSLGQLYVGSGVATVQMPLSSCERYTSCMDCVLARDPYCGWHLTSNNCIAVYNISQDIHSEVVQSLKKVNVERCPAVENTMFNETFYPGHVVRLQCEPGSNLAQVQWRVNDQIIANSSKYQIYPNSLLILNAASNDAGLYTCTSTEFSNVIQNVMYHLRLENFIDHSSVLPQVREQANTLLALKALVIILTLILLALVVWNFYKGHFAVPLCKNTAEPVEHNRNNNHNSFLDTANQHNGDKVL